MNKKLQELIHKLETNKEFRESFLNDYAKFVKEYKEKSKYTK